MQVFIRELISNASDAVERLRFLQTSGTAAAIEGPLEIHVQTDEEKRLLIIQDNGIGMTAEEMETNLGTIAKSGSREYVEVFSRSQSSTKNYESGGHVWNSKGTTGTFEIGNADNVSPGTKIVLHLKEDAADFCKQSVVESIIRKYSNFIGVPVFLNGKQQNVVEPLWCKDPSKVTEEEYASFYRFLSGNAYDSPRYRTTFQTDSPINLRALLFVPSMKPTIFEMAKDGEAGISLYSRKVLLMSKAEKLLPRWLRFIRGVVDSEDIPLNLSRELLQDHGLIHRINRILTARILRSLLTEAKRNPKEFSKFLEDFGLYLKEGIVTETDQSTRENIAKVLRYESSALPAGQLTSFDEYASRMRAGERNIYFLSAPNRHLAEASPYFEAIRKKSPDTEVLFLYEPYDELVLMNLGQYDKKNLSSIEKFLSEDASNTDTVTRRLTSHPCLVTIREAGAMRHLLRTSLANRPATEKYQAMEPVLELNPQHTLVQYLYKLTSTDSQEDKVLATALIDCLFDNAMANAGLLEEVREMTERTTQLLTLLVQRFSGPKTT
ncbi:unnamed protein product [Dibothriocephalus latus]|uniref:Histidine kinase/HSP90-like ATPase domain-containing protein n=1 Tax=Dibothriocephalus latus TaxID=60516 RepID=A0A3P7LLT5_DIBLA|nr:unnamed protein product [Dibothriocephalus latus]